MQERKLAFLMGFHRRLGADSPIHRAQFFEKNLIHDIFSFDAVPPVRISVQPEPDIQPQHEVHHEPELSDDCVCLFLAIHIFYAVLGAILLIVGIVRNECLETVAGINLRQWMLIAGGGDLFFLFLFHYARIHGQLWAALINKVIFTLVMPTLGVFVLKANNDCLYEGSVLGVVSIVYIALAYVSILCGCCGVYLRF